MQHDCELLLSEIITSGRKHSGEVFRFMTIGHFGNSPSEPLVRLFFYFDINRSALEIGNIITVVAIATMLAMWVMVLPGLYDFRF